MTADRDQTAANDGERQQRPMLNSLQVMRGFAAIAVAIYHTNLILALPSYGARIVFDGIATKGWLGVNFFFVLSGFIILYAHARDIGAPARAGAYLWRRFTRVYPVYWVALTGYILAAFAGIGHPDFRTTILDLVSAYLLVPLIPDATLPLKVAWTLVYEVGFYAIFALAILNRCLGLAAFALWLFALVVASVAMGGKAPWLLNIWNIYFLFGAGAFLLFRRLDNRAGPILMGFGVALLIALAATGLVPDRINVASERPWQIVLLATPFTLILLGATMSERQRGWTPARPLLLLGDASYSIYLVHSAVISVVAQLNHKLLPGLIPSIPLFLATAALSVAAGVVFHLVVEKLLLRAAARWQRSRFRPCPNDSPAP